MRLSAALPRDGRWPSWLPTLRRQSAPLQAGSQARPPGAFRGRPGARIVARVDAMIRAGLLEEVRRLLDAGLLANPSAARAIGYRETIEVILGRAPADGLAAAIARDTRALVKKQRTWFRTQLPPHRVLDAAQIRGPEELFPA